MTVVGDVLERRNRVHERIIKALAHWPRDQDMSCIMMWMNLDELEEAAETICKDLPDEITHRPTNQPRA